MSDIPDVSYILLLIDQDNNESENPLLDINNSDIEYPQFQIPDKVLQSPDGMDPHLGDQKQAQVTQQNQRNQQPTTLTIQQRTLLKSYLKSLPDSPENKNRLTQLAQKANISNSISLLKFRLMLLKTPQNQNEVIKILDDTLVLTQILANCKVQRNMLEKRTSQYKRVKQEQRKFFIQVLSLFRSYISGHCGPETVEGLGLCNSNTFSRSNLEGLMKNDTFVSIFKGLINGSLVNRDSYKKKYKFMRPIALLMRRYQSQVQTLVKKIQKK